MAESDIAPDARRMDDAAIIARVRGRDERALEELYERYGRPLYLFAYRRTGADGFAQEVLQDVFAAIWEKPSQFDPMRGALGPWLFRLAHNKAVDLLRREGRIHQRTIDADLSREEAPEDVDGEVWQRARRDRVRTAIVELPDPQRTAIELAFLIGLTHAEVAERMGRPLGTTKSRIRIGLLKLREVLGSSLSD
jgi:RNA polymerase sigma factor (sigma-70 family)